MRVLRIVEGTSVDGPGLRTSVYFAGCRHHCRGCHNPQSWDFDAGNEMSVDDIMRVVQEADEPVTLSGGDPLQQPHDDLLKLVTRIKTETPHSLWCYTGYTWEQLQGMAEMHDVLKHIDVLVDSPFILAKRDISLRFRGSSNQHIIDVQQSLQSGKIVERH